MWSQIVVVGFLCEVLNQLFPFWIFLPGSGYPHVLIETLIVMFGYVVLVHPIIVFWQVVKSR